MQSYIVLDTETTGFSPDNSEILQIAGCKVIDGSVVKKFDSYIKPVGYIPSTIQELTGITMDDVKDAEPLESVLLEFFDFCGDLPFVGHNLSFDYNMLIKKGETIGVDFSLAHQRRGICTLESARKLYNMENYKLVTVAVNLGLVFDLSRFHNAFFDAYITKQVYDKMLFNNPGVAWLREPEILDKDWWKYGKATDDGELPL